MLIKSLEELSVLNNNSPEYKGKMQSYQLNGRNKVPKYSVYHREELTEYQLYLYRRALYGLGAFTEEELKTMCYKKKKRINAVNKKAQKSINVLKQEKINYFCNIIYEKCLQRSKTAKVALTSVLFTTDPRFISKLDFKSLGISQKNIITKLIEDEVLPNNFYKLKQPL